MERTFRSAQTGVGLIEILIALLVLSIGLLGLSALQVNATKQSHSLMLRTQAINLAYDIADRLRINGTAAAAGDYQVDITDSGVNALLQGEAKTDIEHFFAQVSRLPGGDFAISAGQSVGGATRYAIHICWADPYSLGGTVLRDGAVNCTNASDSGFVFMAGI